MAACKISRSVCMIVCIFVLATAMPITVAGQETESDLSAVKRELGSVRAELQALRREIQQLRRLLVQRTREQDLPSRAKIAIKDRPSMGKPDAPVVVAEFSDYQCPYCRQFARTVLPEIKKRYIDTGKVRLVFKDFPLQQIHPSAVEAAVAAHCAGDQGKYWEMHDLLFANPKKLSAAGLKELGTTLGLDDDKYEECRKKADIKRQIVSDLREGAGAGVRGTPTFVVAPASPDGSIQGTVIRGAQPFQVFQQAIDQTLRQSATAKKQP